MFQLRTTRGRAGRSRDDQVERRTQSLQILGERALDPRLTATVASMILTTQQAEVGSKESAAATVIINTSFDFLVTEITQGRIDEPEILAAALASETASNNNESAQIYSLKAIAQQTFAAMGLEFVDYVPTPKKIKQKKAKAQAQESLGVLAVAEAVLPEADIEIVPAGRLRGQDILRRLSDYLLVADYFKVLSSNDALDKGRLLEDQREILARLQDAEPEAVLSLCKNMSSLLSAPSNQNLAMQQQALVQNLLPEIFAAINSSLTTILPNAAARKIIIAFMHEVTEVADYTETTTLGKQAYETIWRKLELDLPRQRRKSKAPRAAAGQDSNSSSGDDSGDEASSVGPVDSDEDADIEAAKGTITEGLDLSKSVIVAPLPQYTSEAELQKVAEDAGQIAQASKVHIATKTAKVRSRQQPNTGPLSAIEEVDEIETNTREQETNTEPFPEVPPQDRTHREIQVSDSDDDPLASAAEEEEEAETGPMSLVLALYRSARLSYLRRPETIGGNSDLGFQKGRDPLDLKREAEKPTGHCITLAVDKVAAFWWIVHFLIHDVTAARYINEFVRAKADDLCEKAASIEAVLIAFPPEVRHEDALLQARREGLRHGYKKVQKEIAELFYISAYALGLLGLDLNLSLSEALTKREKWTSALVEIIPELAENLATLAEYSDNHHNNEELPERARSAESIQAEDGDDGDPDPSRIDETAIRHSENSFLLYDRPAVHIITETCQFYHEPIGYLRAQANWKQKLYTDESAGQSLRRRFVDRPLTRIRPYVNSYEEVGDTNAVDRQDEDNLLLSPGYYYFYHDLLRRIGEHKRKRLPWVLAAFGIGGAYALSALSKWIIHNYYSDPPVVEALISISNVTQGDVGWQIVLNNQILEALANVLVGTQLDSIIYGVFECVLPLQQGYQDAPCGLGTGVAAGQNLTYGIVTDGVLNFPINFQAYIKSIDHTSYFSECSVLSSSPPFGSCSALTDTMARRSLESFEAAANAGWFDELFQNMQDFAAENNELMQILVTLTLLAFGAGLGYFLLKKWIAYMHGPNADSATDLEAIIVTEAPASEGISAALIFHQSHDDLEAGGAQTNLASEQLEL